MNDAAVPRGLLSLTANPIESPGPKMTSPNKPVLSPCAADADLEGRLVRALELRPEVLEGYLFGSQATGRAQPHSDIDVAVYVDASNGSSTAYGYAAELTAHLMAELRSNEIDVVVLNRAPPVLYHRVLRDGRRILTRDLRATTTREGYALSRYCDYLPQLAKIEAARQAGYRRAG